MQFKIATKNTQKILAVQGAIISGVPFEIVVKGDAARLYNQSCNATKEKTSKETRQQEEEKKITLFQRALFSCLSNWTITIMEPQSPSPSI